MERRKFIALLGSASVVWPLSRAAHADYKPEFKMSVIVTEDTAWGRAATGARLAGILSERDIVRAIAESGITVLQLPVAQMMTRNVFTCDVNDSINSVIERMTKGKFRHMPVLDNDRLAGMVSIGDVLKWSVESIRDHIHQLETSIAEFDLIRI